MTTNNTPEIRKYYLDNMRALYHKKTNNSVLLDLQEYNSKLERLIELENPMEKRLPSDSRLVKMCLMKVQENDGSITTKLCKRGTKMPYIPLEDLFDIIHNAHVALNHAGRNGLQRYFRDRYANITKDCIMNYLNTCIDCPRTKRAGHLIGLRRRAYSPNFSAISGASDIFSSELFDASVDNEDYDDEVNEMHDKFDSPNSTSIFKNETDTSSLSNFHNKNNVGANASIISTTPLTIPIFNTSNNEIKKQENCFKRVYDRRNINSYFNNGDDRFTRGQVDIFNMESEPDDNFKFIMLYTNILTEEVRLCSLRSSSPAEVADALINIYCEQGAPVILQSINGRNFAEQIINEVVKLWPQCRQLYASIAFSLQEDALKVAKAEIIERLLNVMKRISSSSWSRSLRFLQWELNTSLNLELGKAPIENSLGHIPTLGLKSSKLIDAIYDKARSEEEIMEFLQDAELLRLSTFCQQSSTVPEKRSRITLQHVDDALNGKMMNFALNGSSSFLNTISNSLSVCSPLASSTNESSDGLQSQIYNNTSFLNRLNKNYNGANVKNEKLRQILAQHQRNNVNNFVQRISERFHQKQNISNNNNFEEKNKSFNGFFDDDSIVETASSFTDELRFLNSGNNIHDSYNAHDKSDVSENQSQNSPNEIEFLSSSDINLELFAEKNGAKNNILS